MLERLRRLRRRPREMALDVRDPALRVVAAAFDLVEADSAVLARSDQWRAQDQAVLRHHIVIPADQVERAREVLAQDGWVLEPAGEGDPLPLHALRVQRLDVLSCARERSRMAGLAQRLGGDWSGWDALQT